MVVNAARVSFSKHKTELDEADIKLLKYLAKHGHWTPYSHPQISLRVKAPVFVRTQLFKHKVGMTENEVSRRYVDDAPEFYTPSSWRGRPTNGAKQGSSEETIEQIDVSNWMILPQGSEPTRHIKDVYEQWVRFSKQMYDNFIEAGVAPEQARMVLPQSMYTEFYWTGSLSAYARICNLRLDPHAQAETREVAGMIDDIIRPLFPHSWQALVKGV